MIDRILRFSIHYPFAVLVLVISVALFGVYAFTKLPIDAVPDITNNQVQINTVAPGLSPEQIEKRVTYVIETGLAGIAGLETTRSLSRNGFSQVTAIFDEGLNIYFARQQINERLSAIREDLPEGAEPKMGPISTGLGEVYMWAVDFAKNGTKEGTVGLQKDGSYLTKEGTLLVTPFEKDAFLRSVQDFIILPQMKGVRGVAEIDSIGGYEEEYHVEPNLDAMISLDLHLDDIIDTIAKSNVSIGPGYLDSNGEGILIKSDERLSTPKEIEEIVLTTRNGTPIRVRDIATVKVGKQMRSGSATKDGKEVVIGTAMMLIGENSRTVADAVDERLEKVKRSLPDDVEVVTLLNRKKLVNATISTVEKNLTEGAILVVAVLFLFLGEIRASLIAASVIPLSMLLTAIGMVESRISGNLMSLGAIDFGLIVDGAVIITENCLRRLSEKQKDLGRLLNYEERIEEVVRASREMIQPTVFGQAIIITVYIPILTLSGVEGKMFHPMAMTVIFALIAAFTLSLTFVPAMIALFVKGEIKEKQSWIIQKSKEVYEPILAKSLLMPEKTILFSCSIVFFSFLLFPFLGKEFVPELDEKDIAMHAIRIPSTSIDQSTAMQRKVEEKILTFPEVEFVFSKTGTAEMASDPMPPNVSDTFIMLKPREEWENPSLEKDALIARIEEAVFQIPGNNYEFTQPIEMRFNELISGVRSDVAVKIYGDDFEEMQKTATKISSVMQKVKGASDIKVSQTEGLPVLDVKVDREKASRLGLNVQDALDTLLVAVGGGDAGELFRGDQRFAVKVRLGEEFRESVSALSRLPIPTKLSHERRHGESLGLVPLGEIAELEVKDGLNEIAREEGKRFVVVQANVRSRDLGSFVEEVKHRIESEVKIPSGSWIGFGGQFENLLSAERRLQIVVPISLTLILVLLYSCFGNIKLALLVFSGVPFALSGGIFALFLRDMSFSISAAIGFIALSGIAVLNGLVLLTTMKDEMQQKEGTTLDAIKRACLSRLRPVLMTACVASLGFIPMALATGTGAEVQKPLATVVIGGLISSTLLTLLVLPTLYEISMRGFRSELRAYLSRWRPLDFYKNKRGEHYE